MTSAARPPNLILAITDQQRAPQHWPQDPAWLDALMPNDAELRRTGLTVLLAEQNARQALAISQHAYVMERGRLVLAGTAEEMAADPRMQAVFLGGRISRA